MAEQISDAIIRVRDITVAFGKTRVLDIQATELHQRVPLFIGSKNDVDLALRTYAHHSELVGA